jgi:Fe2+ or Zn2+ uptake regulation protein
MFTHTCANIIVIGNDNEDNNNKVGEVMVRRWSGYYKKKILNLLPIDGSRVRSKDVHAKARRMGIGPNTVQNYLNLLVGEGSVEPIAERPKEVYYRRCEDVRIEHLISDFMQEITTSLKEIPDAVLSLKKAGLTDSVIKIFTDDDFLMRNWIIRILTREVLKLLNENLSEEKRDKYHYELRLVPTPIGRKKRAQYSVKS